MLFPGAQLLILGMVGEHLERLYVAVSEAPPAVVQERYGFNA